MSELTWWIVLGDYAQMLVAAESEERAVELAREADQWDRDFTLAQSPREWDVIPPAPPTVEGVYSAFAE